MDQSIYLVDPELQPLLESPQTRNLLLNDLMELKEFLSQRMAELTSNINTVLGVEQVGVSTWVDVVGVAEWNGDGGHAGSSDALAGGISMETSTTCLFPCDDGLGICMSCVE